MRKNNPISEDQTFQTSPQDSTSFLQKSSSLQAPISLQDAHNTISDLLSWFKQYSSQTLAQNLKTFGEQSIMKTATQLALAIHAITAASPNFLSVSENKNLIDSVNNFEKQPTTATASAMFNVMAASSFTTSLERKQKVGMLDAMSGRNVADSKAEKLELRRLSDRELERQRIGSMIESLRSSIKESDKEEFLKILEEGRKSIFFFDRYILTTSVGDSKSSLLHIAAITGNKAIISELIDLGFNVNLENNEKATPLLLAAQKGNNNAVEVLIEKGADVDMQMDHGMTPLFMACQENHLKIFDMLVAAGADIDQLTDEDETPLFAAAANGHLEIVQKLIAKGADINQETNKHITPIFAATSNGNLKIVEELIKAKADLLKETKNGMNPLKVAVKNGHLNIVGKIIQQIFIQTYNKKAEVENYVQNSLDLAYSIKNTQIIAVLEEAKKRLGAIKIEQKESFQTYSKKSEKAKESQINSILLSLSRDAKRGDKKSFFEQLKILKTLYPDEAQNLIRNYKIQGRNKLLHSAYVGDNLEIFEKLIEEGVDIDQTGKNDLTQLLEATRHNSLKIITKLIASKEVNIDQAFHDDATLLFIAAQKGNAKIVEKLIEAGARVNQVFHDGATPLFVAAQNGHVEVVEKLIEFGANLNQAMRGNATPLFISAQNGHLKVVERLIRANAELNLAMQDGATPLHIAVQKGHVEVVKKLIIANAATDIKLNHPPFNKAIDIARKINNQKIIQILEEAERNPRRSTATEATGAKIEKNTVLTGYPSFFASVATVIGVWFGAILFRKNQQNEQQKTETLIKKKEEVREVQKKELLEKLNKYTEPAFNLISNNKNLLAKTWYYHENELCLKLEFGDRLNQKIKNHFSAIKDGDKSFFESKFVGGNSIICLKIDNSVIKNFDNQDPKNDQIPIISEAFLRLLDLKQGKDKEVENNLSAICVEEKAKIESEKREEQEIKQREQKIISLKIQIQEQENELNRQSELLKIQREKNKDTSKLDKRISDIKGRIELFIKQLSVISESKLSADKSSYFEEVKISKKETSLQSLERLKANSSLQNIEAQSESISSQSEIPDLSPSSFLTESRLPSTKTSPRHKSEDLAELSNLLLGIEFRSIRSGNLSIYEDKAFKSLTSYEFADLKNIPEEYLKPFDDAFVSKDAKQRHLEYLKKIGLGAGDINKAPNLEEKIAKHYFHELLDELSEKIDPEQQNKQRTISLIYFFLSYRIGDKEAFQESYNRLENEGKDFGKTTGEAHASSADIPTLKKLCYALSQLSLNPPTKNELEKFLNESPFLKSKLHHKEVSVPISETYEIIKSDFDLLSGLVEKFATSGSSNSRALEKAKKSVRDFFCYAASLYMTDFLEGERLNDACKIFSSKDSEDFWKDLNSDKNSDSGFLKFVLNIIENSPSYSKQAKDVSSSIVQKQFESFNDLKELLKNHYDEAAYQKSNSQNLLKLNVASSLR